MDKEKIKAIKEWKEPKTLKQVQAFLGFANFYRRFVPSFSTIAKLLTGLTQKGLPWKWEDKEQRAFDSIKEMICKDPVL